MRLRTRPEGARPSLSSVERYPAADTDLAGQPVLRAVPPRQPLPNCLYVEQYDGPPTARDGITGSASVNIGPAHGRIVCIHS